MKLYVGQLVRTPKGACWVLRFGPERVVVKKVTDLRGPKYYIPRNKVKRCRYDRDPSGVSFRELICSLNAT